MTYVYLWTPHSKFETTDAAAGFWPRRILALMTMILQPGIQAGTYTLPLDASAAPQTGFDFSLHMEQDYTLAQAHGTLTQTMSVVVTIVSGGTTSTEQLP